MGLTGPAAEQRVRCR